MYRKYPYLDVKKYTAVSVPKLVSAAKWFVAQMVL